MESVSESKLGGGEYFKTTELMARQVSTDFTLCNELFFLFSFFFLTVQPVSFSNLIDKSHIYWAFGPSYSSSSNYVKPHASFHFPLFC